MAPSSSAIETALRKAVRKAAKTGEDVTVSGIRTQVEEALGLEEDFLKEGKWKSKSKEIILNAFDEDDGFESEQKATPSKKRASSAIEGSARKKAKHDTPKKEPKAAVKPSKTTSKLNTTPAKTVASKPKKSKSDTPKSAKSTPRSEPTAREPSDSEDEHDSKVEDMQEEEDETPKRKKSSAATSKRKSMAEEDDSEDTDVSLIDKPAKRKKVKGASSEKRVSKKDNAAGMTEVPAKKTARKADVSVNDDDSEDTDIELKDDPPAMKKKKSAKVKAKEKIDESEDTDISLIDEAPARKRKKKDDKPDKKSDKRKSMSKSKPTAAVSMSPDEEMIKQLQKQLVQCGIRKRWHIELAPYETVQDKVRHLKKMLEAAGMTGRFSADKAAKIKEQRELAEELESAKAFERNWGYDIDTGKGRRARPTKSMVVDDADSDEDVEQPPRPQAGLATGLVDFGDSGDSGSD